MATGDAKSHVDDYKQKCLEQDYPLPKTVLGGGVNICKFG